MILWIPEATKKLYGPKGKPFLGGTRKKKLILHTTEFTNRLPNYTAPPHLTGEILSPTMVEDGLWQHIPFDLAAYSLRENWLEDDYWTWQVEMLAKAAHVPVYPDQVYKNIAWIVQWFVENLGVRAVFADFSVMKYGAQAPQRMTDEQVQQFEGIMGHAHFGRDIDEHWDPGRLDVPRVQKYMATAPPPPPPPPGNEEEEMNALKLGDEGALVAWYQAAINGWHDTWDHDPARKIEITEVFDDPTEEQVKAYQKSAGMEQNGVIDGALAPALARYNPWFSKNTGAIDEVARGQADAAHGRLDKLHAV